MHQPIIMDKVKASPVQQQQQSRLLNRRKSLDPVRLREVRQELFGAEDFIAKVIEFDQWANETIIKIFELGLEVEEMQLKVVHTYFFKWNYFHEFIEVTKSIVFF